MTISARIPRADLGGPSWPRLVLLLVPAWWTLRWFPSLSVWCFLDYVNLAFHEAGHIVFRLGGELLTVLGGTLMQLLVPIVLVVYFLVRQRQPFGSALCLWWLGESLANVSRYMADARALELPLVGGGEHDWTDLFYRFGLLSEPAVNGISGGTHLLGVGIMLLGLAWGVFFVLPGDLQGRISEALESRFPFLSIALEP